MPMARGTRGEPQQATPGRPTIAVACPHVDVPTRPRRRGPEVRPQRSVPECRRRTAGWLRWGAGGLLRGADHDAGATGPGEAPAPSHPGLLSWWNAGLGRCPSGYSLLTSGDHGPQWCPRGDTPHAHPPRGGWLDHHPSRVPVSRGRRRGPCREECVDGGGMEAEEYRPGVEVGRSSAHRSTGITRGRTDRGS